MRMRKKMRNRKNCASFEAECFECLPSGTSPWARPQSRVVEILADFSYSYFSLVLGNTGDESLLSEICMLTSHHGFWGFHGCMLAERALTLFTLSHRCSINIELNVSQNGVRIIFLEE